MHDVVLRFRGHLTGHRRFSHGHEGELPSQAFLVECHCLAAVILEMKIRIDLSHSVPSCSLRKRTVIRAIRSNSRQPHLPAPDATSRAPRRHMPQMDSLSLYGVSYAADW